MKIDKALENVAFFVAVAGEGLSTEDRIVVEESCRTISGELQALRNNLGACSARVTDLIGQVEWLSKEPDDPAVTRDRGGSRL